MRIVKQVCNAKLCVGCSACANKCPTLCISMIQDREGFYRPYIDIGKCVDCGLCKKVCPIINSPIDTGKQPDTFAMQNLDTSTRLKSSSGGVFSLLAEHILNCGGVVVGTGFDKKLNVVHKVISNTRDLPELLGSKYVQSQIGNVYRETKNHLDEGTVVLFTGTPCQIGGLTSFLGREYSNLYTQDFICHGVPSPKAWRKYVEFREKEKNSNAIYAQFRCKDAGWQHYSLRLDFENDTSYTERVDKDIYLRSFVMNMCLRPSCEKCLFKQIHRQADITLADFWGIEKRLLDWNDDTGTSLVMVHTDKGMELLKTTSSNTKQKQVDFLDGVSDNPSMLESVRFNLLREGFLRDIDKMEFSSVYNKYCSDAFLAKKRRKIAWAVGRIRK